MEGKKEPADAGSVVVVWKAGGGLKCGSMFHLDKWVVPPSPLPPKKNRFLFSRRVVIQ
jgi:hypothetical protein